MLQRMKHKLLLFIIGSLALSYLFLISLYGEVARYQGPSVTSLKSLLDDQDDLHSETSTSDTSSASSFSTPTFGEAFHISPSQPTLATSSNDSPAGPPAVYGKLTILFGDTELEY